MAILTNLTFTWDPYFLLGRMCMLADGSNVKGSSQQSWTSVPKVREGGHYFQDGPTYYLGGGMVCKRYYDRA